MGNMEIIEKRCVELGIVPRNADFEWDSAIYNGGAITEVAKATIRYCDNSTSRLEVEYDNVGRIYYIGPCR